MKTGLLPRIPMPLNPLRPLDQLFLSHTLPRLDLATKSLSDKSLFDFGFVGGENILVESGVIVRLECPAGYALLSVVEQKGLTFGIL